MNLHLKLPLVILNLRLTVVLILIRPSAPAGTARTMQAKSDLSSKRVGSINCDGEIRAVGADSGNITTFSLNSATILEFVE